MYEQLNLLLTTHEDSPPITEDDLDALIEFCREELDATGELRTDMFENVELDE